LNKADKRAAEVGKIPPASINDRSGSHHHAAKPHDDVNRLLNTPATGHDILGHNETFTRQDLEAAHDKTAVSILLNKDVTGSKVPRHLLTDDDSTDSR
jgi:hypothetical protein